jgi:hypothetical protein
VLVIALVALLSLKQSGDGQKKMTVVERFSRPTAVKKEGFREMEQEVSFPLPPCIPAALFGDIHE